MSEHNSEDKTEDATESKLNRAHKEGQVLRSKELIAVCMMLVGIMFALSMQGQLQEAIFAVFKNNFILTPGVLSQSKEMLAHLISALKQVSLILVILFVLVFFAGFFSPLLIGKWCFNLELISLKFDRLNPMKWLQKIFSVKTLVELGKSILKCLVILFGVYVALSSKLEEIYHLDSMELTLSYFKAIDIWLFAALLLSCFVVLIAVVDVPYQMWDYKKKMKMTKQEVKDDMKNTEGNPEIKSKRREKMNQLRKSRMLADVAKADVVITNPTHYSVALQYNKTMQAPIVIAKGVDFLAQMINKVARHNNVPFVSAPPLARSLYHNVELGKEIPQGLYVAVANVLSYIATVAKTSSNTLKMSDAAIKIPEELQC